MTKRIGIYFLGLWISAFGIALVILSALGAGPLDAVGVGLYYLFGLTIGTWSIISQGFLVLLTALLERKRPRLESFMAITIRSWFLDGWLYLVFPQAAFSATLLQQWASFTIGMIAVGIGIGIYIEANLPKTPVDGLMIAIHHRFGWSFNISRILIESCAVVVGFLLNGPVGLGTVIVAAALGRIIQTSNRRFKKIFRTPKAA